MTQRGFSLIELLIVITIIAALAAFVAPKYFSRIAISQQQVARAQIDNLDKALTQYRLDTGHYPTAGQGLAALDGAPPGETRWRGPRRRGQSAVPARFVWPRRPAWRRRRRCRHQEYRLINRPNGRRHPFKNILLNLTNSSMPTNHLKEAK